MNENQDFEGGAGAGEAGTEAAAPEGAQFRKESSGIRQRAQDLVHSADTYVRENPVPAILGALAVGFALGLMTRLLEEPERRTSTVEDLLHDTRDALRGVLGAAAKKSRHAFDSSTDAVRGAASTVAGKARDLEEDAVDSVAKWWKRAWSNCCH